TGCRRVLFIEGDPATFERLQSRFAGIDRVRCLRQLVSDRAGKAIFHRMSMDQSSSLLPLKRHAELYPSIRECERIELDVDTLDNLLRREGVVNEHFNILAIDVQGAERLVLAGAEETLSTIDAIVAAINYDELYEGCALVTDLDSLLEAKGFTRVEETCP